MATLIAQHEVERSHQTAGGPLHTGFEVFRGEDGYFARLHARVYDGLKVTSSYTTEAVALEATDNKQAMSAAGRLLRSFDALYGDLT